MKLETMTKDERSLLLFFECKAVDSSGRFHGQHLNADDFDLAAQWNKERFIENGRIASEHINERGQYWCALSDEAFALAAEERKARARRTWTKRSYRTTDEKRKDVDMEAA